MQTWGHMWLIRTRHIHGSFSLHSTIFHKLWNFCGTITTLARNSTTAARHYPRILRAVVWALKLLTCHQYPLIFWNHLTDIFSVKGQYYRSNGFNWLKRTVSQGVRNLTVMRCGERITTVYGISDISYCVVKKLVHLLFRKDWSWLSEGLTKS